jgi:hypothetical protein
MESSQILLDSPSFRNQEIESLMRGMTFRMDFRKGKPMNGGMPLKMKFFDAQIIS